MRTGVQISGHSKGGLDPAERTDTSKDAEAATVLMSLVYSAQGRNMPWIWRRMRMFQPGVTSTRPLTFPPAGTASVLCCGPV